MISERDNPEATPLRGPTTTESRLCVRCQEWGLETLLVPEALSCDECGAVCCPYCRQMVLDNACRHVLASTWSEDPHFSDTDLPNFPVLDEDKVYDLPDEKVRSLAAAAFGSLLPLLDAYGGPSCDCVDQGEIMAVSLAHLHVPHHAIRYICDNGIGGRTDGTYFLAEDVPDAHRQVEEFQQRLVSHFEEMRRLVRLETRPQNPPTEAPGGHP